MNDHAASWPHAAPVTLAARRARHRIAVGWLGAGWVILLILAVATPINHDEDQYLAAALLTKSGHPFIDFLYLQTPLQPYLTAPLVGLVEGWNLLVLRLATATAGALLMLALYSTAIFAGASASAARLGALAMACCHIFLFSAGVVRNDMLPALFAGVAMVAGVAALRGRGDGYILWALAGLALGAATSTKLSYAIPAAATGAFLLCRWWVERRDPVSWRAFAGFAIGGLAGLLPTMTAFTAAPSGFLYGVLEYGATAPFEWYALNGAGDRLLPTAKALDSLLVLARGPALLALLLVVGDMYRRQAQGRATPPALRFLEVLTIAGLIAGLMPTPTWRQYFLPMLAPLFARAALVPLPKGNMRRIGTTLALILAVVGSLKHAKYLGHAASSGEWNILTLSRQAHWIGREVHATGAGGPIATLSPHLMIDSGLPLMPEFATGPFAYRTGDRIDRERQLGLVMTSPSGVAQRLDCAAPAAIITGLESHHHIDRIGLDTPLRRYAQAHGYRLLRYPGSEAELYVRARKADAKPGAGCGPSQGQGFNCTGCAPTGPT
ncbi:hypothetical protein CLG96_12065 [Sphingomonas oleivorans]|uniref:Glycosyltransferase RgtA/B/C/D-like domain-containing protein n=1 Tax=Sphingomonas oleivorans TaxID=1735121 RepID=A0A2T5FVT5_9SPHN|nr:hypothetical protein [Sphingomonas oleivorans]PTQ09893.1 hypothetical protein CLG96_12065 [Sphingomonas oleivorans]